MSFLNFNYLNFTQLSPNPYFYNFLNCFGDGGNPNFNFSMLNSGDNSKLPFNENLKLNSNGKPEISAEVDYDDETLIKLKQSPARQELSNILRNCDDKNFTVTDKDCQKMDIISNSGIPGWQEFDEKFDKILISKTDMVISIIQGIDQLDTKNMTEDEMKEKVNEYKGIIEKELKKMEDLRKLLDKGAEIVKEYNENKDNPELQEKIKSFEGEMNDLASISEAGINDEETQ